jgi:spermidine synthase
MSAEKLIQAAIDTERSDGREPRVSDVWKYYVLFFLSGAPALLYQIVWQRALFAIYGVNIESVTIIVTMFMLGLGLGSLAGGRLSRISRIPLLAIFSAIEYSIAAFGLISLRVFHLVASFTAGATLLSTGITTFVLLLVPTMLMGSTLPLLVAHLVKKNGNVGQSVGVLYFANTLGSALACFAAAYFLMREFGQSGSVKLAATINACVATAALILSFTSKARSSLPQQTDELTGARKRTIPFSASMLLCGVVGFIALGCEMLWYRLYSFSSGRSARTFALLLAWYLAGLAYGSLAAHDACRGRLSSDFDAVLRAISTVVIWGSVAAFLLGPALSIIVTHLPGLQPTSLVFIPAALLGSAFPLLSHASIDPGESKTGERLGWLYLSNIVGCTSGSYLVGFVAMDHLSTRGVSVALLSLGLLIGVSLAVSSMNGRPSKYSYAAWGGAAILICAAWPVYSHIYERLLLKTAYSKGMVFQHLIESRHGVIAVSPENVVFGGGVYDGMIETSLVDDKNSIFRVYALNALLSNPEDVLVVGLSAGAWTQVIANDPQVKRVTAVEIDPGYLQIIPLHPEVASLLRNPKLEIVIDDGRRWLLSHPDKKFDAIVMNTSQHWLAHSSNLLSADFLRIARRHLKPGGVLYYNTTDSPEVLLTGATVFPYALRVGNFLAVSDNPIEFNEERWKQTLSDYRIDGRPVLNPNNPLDLLALNGLTAAFAPGSGLRAKLLESGESIRSKYRGFGLVSDDNMGVEWNARMPDPVPPFTNQSK